MTTITLPRATVEQALEALKYFRDTAICSADIDSANEVIPNLEAALAQQAEPVQEPVAWRDSDNSDPGQGCTYDKAKAARWPHIYKQPLYTAPPQQAEPVEPITRLFGTLPVHDAQQAEPVEPVAWINGKELSDLQYYKRGTVVSEKGSWRKTPLYTAPPQRKPLTDEEIDALPWNGSPRQFARAVERALEEKNRGR